MTVPRIGEPCSEIIRRSKDRVSIAQTRMLLKVVVLGAFATILIDDLGVTLRAFQP